MVEYKRYRDKARLLYSFIKETDSNMSEKKTEAAIAKGSGNNGSNKKKIALICGIIAAIVVIAAVVLIVKNDVFSASNYSYLHYDKYITLPKYKGLEYKVDKVNVTDKEVKKEIDSRVQAAATTKAVKTGTVKKGDTVNISYVGTINGKKFDGGSANNTDLKIGSNTMIKGFESGLIGKKIGSKTTLNLIFPKNYGSDSSSKKLRGKKVKFVVTINSKSVTTVPKYDVAFIKANSKYTNKKDYETSVKKDLLKNKEQTAESNVKQKLWGQVINKAKVKKYPQKQLNYEVMTARKQYEDMAKKYYNMSLDDYIKQTGMTKKQFEKQLKSYSKSTVKQKLVMNAIAKKENIKVTDKEYKKYLKDMLKNAGMTESQFKSQYNMTIEEYGNNNNVKANLLYDKVLERIKKLGKKK